VATVRNLDRHTALDAVSPQFSDEIRGLRVKPAMTDKDSSKKIIKRIF
jgi:hypothetical protein